MQNLVAELNKAANERDDMKARRDFWKNKYLDLADKHEKLQATFNTVRGYTGGDITPDTKWGDLNPDLKNLDKDGI